MKRKTDDIEYASVEEIKLFQEERLAEALRYLQRHSKFYRRLFKKHGIDIADIRKLEDLARIPFTDKEDLQRYNDDFICCAPDKIVDYVTTSGTLGEPVCFAFTEKDLQRQALNEKKSFLCEGIKPGDKVQLMVTMDRCFIAGMAFFLGLRELGAGVIRVGNGIPELQWDIITRMKPDAIMCIPSFILRLIQYAEEHGIDYKNSSVKRIIGTGESLRNQDFTLNQLSKTIKSKWDVELYSTYSSTEMGATFSECQYGCGGHLHPELVIVEIVGDDGKPVPDGQYGEIVVTTLGVEAMPILRFRTGDIARKCVEPCKCGRNSYRLSPLVGRKNNMIKLKGTTLYPPALNEVLDNTDYVENYVVEVKNSAAGTDEVIVRIGLRKGAKEKYAGKESELIKELRDRFRSRIRVAPVVEIMPAEQIQLINFPGKSRKAIKFIDNRKK